MPRFQQSRRTPAAAKVSKSAFHRVWWLALLVGVSFLVVSPVASVTEADIIASFPNTLSPTNLAQAPSPLVTHAFNRRVRCGGRRVTISITATVNGAGSVGTTHITLPRRCRGNTYTFNNPGLHFPSHAYNLAAQLSLVSNTWGSNMGTIRVCVSRTGTNCPTAGSRLTLTQATTPPYSSTMDNLANGRNYGAPWIRTALGNPGGTATIVLHLYQYFRNTVTGDHAVIQVDTVTITVVQN